ncbi:FtsB/FtsL family cell division protein [Cupriavidus numazuensis]|uniref:Uncharacterized protein n=1 Tax=Cupriavidus numazuensis TaxID=221992 RepID=A0ABM8TB50_9BURK|nr:hypothetical protein [Cupriavidus numazuensis]CAG2132181.1 hypothetical protein LMG26411_00571 [Cupriavidus numazuensis]
MSESTTPAQCRDEDWSLARDCGLMAAEPGTNAWDAALGRFADGVRAALAQAGGQEPVHLDGRICEHCGEGNAVLTFEDGQFSSNCDMCCADCDYFMVERLNQLIGVQRQVPWDKFPGWLIDHHEGDTITEEGLQHALEAMLKVHPLLAAPAPVASPAAPAPASLFDDMLQSLEHVEAVYRLNVVKDNGEPSSTLDNLQRVIARAKGAAPAPGDRQGVALSDEISALRKPKAPDGAAYAEYDKGYNKALSHVLELLSRASSSLDEEIAMLRKDLQQQRERNDELSHELVVLKGRASSSREEVERDAARYRWLRDSDRIGDDGDDHIIVGAAGGEDVLWGERMDSAIDADMLAAAEAPNESRGA